MANYTVSSTIDTFMQSANLFAARNNLGLGTAATSNVSTTGNAGANEVVKGSDTRLTDDRTPTAHKSTHATGGSDALSPADIGAAVSTRQIIAGLGLTGGGDLSADRTLTVAYGLTNGTAVEGVQVGELVASLTTGKLTTSQIPAFTGDVTSAGGTTATTVAKLQGNAVATTTPVEGQVLQWDGEQWVPGAIPNGGSGGGGLVYFLDYGSTTGISPTTGLPTSPVAPSLLGREYTTGSGSITSANLTEGSYSLVCGFVTAASEPNVTSITPGLWDFNIWADVAGASGSANQTQFQIRIYKYDSTAGTYGSPIATSDDVYIYDPATTAQYIANVTMPQQTLLATDRIYIELWAQKNVNQTREIRFYFDSAHPAHVHTTLPSVTGSGLVKVINGVYQSPASKLVNADVASDAAIAVNKIAGLATSATVDTTNAENITSGTFSPFRLPGTIFANTNGTAAGLSTTLPVGSGGTGQTTYTDGQLLIGNSATGGLTKSTLTAGDNVTIDIGNGAITINSTASGGGGGTVTTTGTPASGNMTKFSGGTSITNAVPGTDYLEPFASQTQKTVYAAPNAADGTPLFRALVASDLPSSITSNTSGTAAGLSATLAIASGGTNATDATTARTNLSAAKSGANTDITSVALTTGTISGVPSAGSDLVNKSYADSIGSGINFHEACDYATLAALSAAYTYSNGTSGVGATITANAAGTLTIDGYMLLGSDVGKRLLIKNESGSFVNNTTPSAAFNGVYTLTTAGTVSVPFVLTRATDYDTSGSGTNEIQAGDFILVLDGSQANTAWVQQTKLPITVGATSLSFTQFAAAAAGVTSFNTTLNGLVTSGSTGAVTLGGTLGVAGGGTGATTLTGYVKGSGTSALAASATIPVSDLAGTLGVANGGTGVATLTGLVKASGTSAFTAAAPGTDYVLPSGNITGTAANVTGVVAVANGGTNATNGTDALANLGNIIFPVSVRQPSNMTPASTTATTMTFAVGAGIGGTASIDSYTLVQGDVVMLIGQTTGNQNGPWVITTLGTASVAAVLTRPSWFTTGTAKSGTLCGVQYGNTNTGFVMTVSGPLNTGAGIVIGTSAITVSQIWGRSTLAITGANTFTSTQTFAVGSTTLVPWKFQAGAVLTTPIAHAVEYDGTQMYLSNTAAERLPVATSKIQINAQTGTTYTLVLTDAGYLITANNAGAITLSVPTNASVAFPIGTQILVNQLGAGQVTVAAVTPGTTTVSGRNGLKTSGQYAMISLVKVATDQWIVNGDASV